MYYDRIRAPFIRFLFVILSRPGLHMEDAISPFKLAEFPRTLFSSNGSLLHCVAKSKVINILEGLLPHRLQYNLTLQTLPVGLWSFLMPL